MRRGSISANEIAVIMLHHWVSPKPLLNGFGTRGLCTARASSSHLQTATGGSDHQVMLHMIVLLKREDAMLALLHAASRFFWLSLADDLLAYL